MPSGFGDTVRRRQPSGGFSLLRNMTHLYSWVGKCSDYTRTHGNIPHGSRTWFWSTLWALWETGLTHLFGMTLGLTLPPLRKLSLVYSLYLFVKILPMYNVGIERWHHGIFIWEDTSFILKSMHGPNYPQFSFPLLIPQWRTIGIGLWIPRVYAQ